MPEFIHVDGSVQFLLSEKSSLVARFKLDKWETSYYCWCPFVGSNNKHGVHEWMSYEEMKEHNKGRVSDFARPMRYMNRKEYTNEYLQDLCRESFYGSDCNESTWN